MVGLVRWLEISGRAEGDGGSGGRGWMYVVDGGERNVDGGGVEGGDIDARGLV